jgi:hypothetical protein
MTKKTITTEEAKGKTLKPEFQHGGSRRQEILDNLMMTETEYLEALNKATNGGVEAWAQ